MQEPQTEAGSSATSNRGTCQHGVPSLSPAASVRPRSPSASRPPPSQAPKATCPVPDVGLGQPVMWGADADNDDDNADDDDDDNDDDSDSAHQPGLENLRDSGSHQTFSPAMLHGASGGAEVLHGPQPVLLAPHECAVSRMHPSSSLQRQSRGDDAVDDDGDEAHMEEDDEKPCDARLHVEAAGAASPDRSSDAGLLDQDRPERIRLRSAAANASSEGELDSPVDEPEVPEEGWMW